MRLLSLAAFALAGLAAASNVVELDSKNFDDVSDSYPRQPPFTHLDDDTIPRVSALHYKWESLDMVDMGFSGRQALSRVAVLAGLAVVGSELAVLWC